MRSAHPMIVVSTTQTLYFIPIQHHGHQLIWSTWMQLTFRSIKERTMLYKEFSCEYAIYSWIYCTWLHVMCPIYRSYDKNWVFLIQLASLREVQSDTILTNIHSAAIRYVILIVNNLLINCINRNTCYDDLFVST